MTIMCKISLALATQRKVKRLDAVISRMRALTNAYIRNLWGHPGRLDAETLKRIQTTHLKTDHRTNCLRLALQIINRTNRSISKIGKTANVPNLTGYISLCEDVCTVQRGKGSFDFVLSVKSFVYRDRIIIPFKSTAVINRWLSIPGARTIHGALLGDGYAYIYIRIPDQDVKKEGRCLGIDMGINKLMVDSDGRAYGGNCKAIINRVARTKRGSKGWLRAAETRKAYFNAAVKQIPYASISTLAVEDLRNIKKGKKKNRSKQFRKMVAPWAIQQVVGRIKFLASLNRVQVVAIDPAYTSRRCPKCQNVANENRNGEVFNCISCGYRQDADYVGAINILHKAMATLGRVRSPSIKTVDKTELFMVVP